MTYLAQDKNELLTITRKLTVEDFTTGDLRDGISSYSNNVDVSIVLTFEDAESMTEQELKFFLPTGYIYGDATPEDVLRNRTTKHIRVSEDVKMQGVRKDKQILKKKLTAKRLRKELRGKALQARIQTKIDELNAEIAQRVDQHNRELIARIKRQYTTVDNWKFDDKEIAEIDEQLQSLSALQDSLRKRKNSLQDAEMRKHVAETDLLTDEMREAVLAEMEENGMARSFHRHLVLA